MPSKITSKGFEIVCECKSMSYMAFGACRQFWSVSEVFCMQTYFPFLGIGAYRADLKEKGAGLSGASDSRKRCVFH